MHRIIELIDEADDVTVYGRSSRHLVQINDADPSPPFWLSRIQAIILSSLVNNAPG